MSAVEKKIDKSSQESPKFSFLETCADGQEVSKDWPGNINVHDNRLDMIPRRAVWSFQAEGASNLLNWYKEFLQYKFLYFRYLLEDAENANANIKNILGCDWDKWESIINKWKSQADRETLAYLCRISQIPKELVDKSWYNDLKEFKDWSICCQEQLEGMKAKVKIDAIEDFYQLIEIKAHQPKSILFEDYYLHNWIEESVTRGLSERTENTINYLMGKNANRLPKGWITELFSPKTKTDIFPFSVSPADRIYQTLTLNFLTKLTTGEFDRETFLTSFLKLVNNEACCDLSDFMEVSKDGDHIRLSVTTVEISDEERKEKLGFEETYQTGQGITGSILVQREPNYLFHVGSDDIDNDPRQSPSHTNKYQDIYGTLYNFWTFPIVRDTHLVAAFRVVNKRDTSGVVQPNTIWPLINRYQLCEVAWTFSRLWKVVEAIDFNQQMWSHASGDMHFAKELIENLDLHWIKESFLAEIILHLQAVTQQKEEKRGIGCSLGIVEKNEGENLIRGMSPYLGLQIENTDQLSKIARNYRKVSPTGGIFFLNSQKEFLGVFDLRFNNQGRGRIFEGIEAIRPLTEYYNAIVFLVEENNRSISFYYKDNLSGEFYLSERTGNWKARYFSSPLEKIKKVYESIGIELQSLQLAVVKRLYEEAWQLSHQKHAAMIILADPGEIERNFDYGNVRGSPLELPINNISGSKFSEMARQDGAMVVSNDGIVQRAGVILHPKREILYSEELAPLVEDRGARHRTGAQVASACRNALVILISENQGISILLGGSSIAWDM